MGLKSVESSALDGDGRDENIDYTIWPAILSCCRQVSAEPIERVDEFRADFLKSDAGCVTKAP